MARKKFYAVRVGRRPGVYEDLESCKEQVLGYSRTEYKGFGTYGEAYSYFFGLSSLHEECHVVRENEAVPISTKSRKDLLRSQVRVRPTNQYILEFDGAARCNPGPAGAGGVIRNIAWNEEVGRLSEDLGTATNNVAEYTALIRGLQAALAVGIKSITARGDSNLIVNQVSGEWRVNSPNLQILHKQAVNLATEFETFSIEHIYRENNQTADELANYAIDLGGWHGLRTGPFDFVKFDESRGSPQVLYAGRQCSRQTDNGLACMLCWGAEQRLQVVRWQRDGKLPKHDIEGVM